MCIRSFVTILACCCLLAISSAQAGTGKTLQDVNAVNDTVGQVVNSPVGGLIPEPLKTILMTAVMVVSTILGILFKKQSNARMQTLSCVAKAVENSGAPGKVVKKEVGALMSDYGGDLAKYNKLNAIIDQAKQV
jgi:hypothetical protein